MALDRHGLVVRFANTGAHPLKEKTPDQTIGGKLNREALRLGDVGSEDPPFRPCARMHVEPKLRSRQ
jgi:hypothetical protein